MTGVPKRIIKHSLNVNPSVTPVSQKRRVFCSEKSKSRRWTEAEGCVSTSRTSILHVRRIITHFQKLTTRSSQLWVFHSNAFSTHTKATTRNRWQKKTRRKPPSTWGQGTYCYTKMPFGLKNAGATYQRLVDEAFQSHIGQNLEVYVDDMVVKSKPEREMLADIA
ncbi:hypothetical protein Tco_0076971 [Tanacetum coccineum]